MLKLAQMWQDFQQVHISVERLGDILNAAPEPRRGGASAPAAPPAPTPRPPRAVRDALEFLPAALEVVETPPNPLGRAIAWTLCAVFAAALAWSWFGRVDVVAVAPGRVIPSDVVTPAQTLAVVVPADGVRPG